MPVVEGGLPGHWVAITRENEKPDSGRREAMNREGVAGAATKTADYIGLPMQVLIVSP